VNVLDLFSGIGGFSLGLERAGMRTVAFCEVEDFCRKVLAKNFPGVPCYDDVRTLTSDRLQADGIAVNAIAGGFPCQDISYAGPGAGLAGDRSGLWFQYARLIGELGPEIALVENVSALLDRGLADVLGTLADLRYDAEWDTVPACSVGHSHMRPRVFIVAYSHRFDGRERLRHSLARAFRTLQAGDGFARARARERARLANPSELYGGADGLPDGMERNHAIGNAVAPAVAEVIGEAIMTARPHYIHNQTEPRDG
jgi:DNA (cytosine-5)-methyltransferase 1